MKVNVLTDSTAYLPADFIKNHEVQVISLGVHWRNQLMDETAIDTKAFFHDLSEMTTLPTSSQPSVESFLAHFIASVKQNCPVIGIFISSDMSGTFNTAVMAKKMILENHPQAEIHLIDSRTNSMQMGFAVMEAVSALASGISLPKVVERVRNLVHRSRFIFAPKTLTYLKKGGRIGGASAFVGSVLNIIPILTVEDGKTAVLTKVRSQRKAVMTMIQTVQDDFSRYGAGDLVVHHINEEAAGQRLAADLEKTLQIKVPVIPIGPVIGLHVGPGTIGIAYTTEKNRV